MHEFESIRNGDALVYDGANSMRTQKRNRKRFLLHIMMVCWVSLAVPIEVRFQANQWSEACFTLALFCLALRSVSCARNLWFRSSALQPRMRWTRVKMSTMKMRKFFITGSSKAVRARMKFTRSALVVWFGHLLNSGYFILISHWFPWIGSIRAMQIWCRNFIPPSWYIFYS